MRRAKSSATELAPAKPGAAKASSGCPSAPATSKTTTAASSAAMGTCPYDLSQGDRCDAY
jgi:hypothetical protein